nr:hypothetical protein BCCFPMHH_00008 [uncultured bacterium]
MKKQLLAATIAATISMPSMADFLGVYAGLDYRSNETSFSDVDGDESGSNVAGYVAFEHFIPLIPNAKLKYADLSNSDIDNDSSVMNGILYYQLFDNGLFEFDFGLAYTAIESNIGTESESASLGQAYLAGKAHIPGTGVHAFAEAIGGSLTDDDALDAEVGLQYTINPESLLVNVGLRAGYRLQELEFKNQTSKQTNEGWFAGVEVHF